MHRCTQHDLLGVVAPYATQAPPAETAARIRPFPWSRGPARPQSLSGSGLRPVGRWSDRTGGAQGGAELGLEPEPADPQPGLCCPSDLRSLRPTPLAQEGGLGWFTWLALPQVPPPPLCTWLSQWDKLGLGEGLADMTLLTHTGVHTHLGESQLMSPAAPLS